MATGIIRIVVGSAVAALALAAPALANQDASVGFDVAAAKASDGYDAAALKAMGARYQAMADYYLGNDASEATQGVSEWDVISRSDVVSRYVDNNAPVFDDRVAPDGSQPQLHGTESGSAFVGRETPDGFQPQLRGPEAVPVSGTDDGFDWRIFGIATGSALLAAALGGTALLATRLRGRVAHP
jgi:hypothetical protein